MEKHSGDPPREPTLDESYPRKLPARIVRDVPFRSPLRLQDLRREYR